MTPIVLAPATVAPVTGPIRVLLVDDHAMFSRLLTMSLAECDDIDVVGCATTAAHAQTLATSVAPDVVVLDYRLPDGNGVALAAALSAALPALRIVMLTAYQDPQVLREAIAAGCVAFVTKDRELEELIRVVRAAARDEAVLAPADLRALSAAAVHGGPLTEREAQVLHLLASGESTREIARRLFLSINTVRNHVQNVLQKLGAHSRLEAVATARRLGIVDDRHD